jgi:hypothetical protein
MSKETFMIEELVRELALRLMDECGFDVEAEFERCSEATPTA